MARFEMEFPDNLLEGLDDVIDEVAPKMIEEALPIYQKAVESSIASVVSTAPEDVKRQTGDLARSVKPKGPKQTADGAFIGNLTFDGYDSKGSPNVVKAAGLEYGNSHQAARPFMDNAKNSCESKVIETMQSVFDREVDVT